MTEKDLIVATNQEQRQTVEDASDEKTEISVKPAKNFEEQIEILRTRKLYIENNADAIRVLERSNYYRLRGYYIHLQEDDCDNFRTGVSFTQISALHDFDNELRVLLLRLLLDIEVVGRARIAYTLAHAWGAMGYLKFENYGSSCDSEKFHNLIARIASDLSNSRERFIKTYVDKYAGQFPIWVAVEVMSFGDLSKLYHLLPSEQKKVISNAYDGLDETLFTNWIQCAAMLRNLCAHNSRLYARSIPTAITIEKEQEKYISELTNGKFTVFNHSLFSYLIALRRISARDSWNSFICKFEELLAKYDCFIELKRLGLPYQWKQVLFKK